MSKYYLPPPSSVSLLYLAIMTPIKIFMMKKFPNTMMKMKKMTIKVEMSPYKSGVISKPLDYEAWNIVSLHCIEFDTTNRVHID